MFIVVCKNPDLGSPQTLRSHFLPPAGCGSVFPEKVVDMLEIMVVNWQKVRLKMADDAKLSRPICSTFEELYV